MIPKISVCCFIKDNMEGAFCLFESMAQLMPFADEYIVMDCGSTDGTLETLRRLQVHNPRLKVVKSTFHTLDASIFATLANDLVAMCKNDLVLYHQADEIWHEDLLAWMLAELEDLTEGIPEGWKGLNFWRYQLKENFQQMKWWPHPVNRLDLKSRMVHVGDGMNTTRPWDPPFVGAYDGGATWQVSYEAKPYSLPTNHMILDVSMIGGFLENIIERRRKHAPLWREDPNQLHGWGGGSVDIHQWIAEQRQNPAWTAKTSPFNIPAVMRGLVGEAKYFLRPEIFDRIAHDKGLNA